MSAPPIPIPAAEVLAHARRLSGNAVLNEPPPGSPAPEGSVSLAVSPRLGANADVAIDSVEPEPLVLGPVTDRPATSEANAGNPATAATIERRDVLALDKKLSAVTPAGQGAAGVLRSPAVVQTAGMSCCKPLDVPRVPLSSVPPPHAA